MRFFNTIIAIAVLLGFAACEKREVANLDLKVTTSKTTYKVNDTVTFNITGNPDQLMFYSGEIGHKYSYKDRTRAESNNITLEFASNRAYGSLTTQPNSLTLWASQTFNGTYTADNVNEANDWVDITAAFTISPLNSAGTYVSSGVVNLTTLGSLGFNLDITKPVYFAFKYKGSTGSTQTRCWVNQFDINTTTTDGQVLSVTNIGSTSWSEVKVLPTSPVSWTFDKNTNGIVTAAKFQGGAATILSNEVWLITNGLDLTSVQSDRGVAIKDIRARLDQYQYIFTEPGTYTVTFVGANINIYGESRAVKEFTITISN